VTGQEVQADLGLGRTLELDGVSFANVQLVFADAPAFAAIGLDRRPALLLGMAQLRLFRRVAIDFATRRILFDVPWKRRGQLLPFAG